ncbi:MAG: hypothetical protein QNJ18_23100 [Xenococcaceae cyanobacterium MO_167.B52]|nr:hypothetical protein [Xenococcaceae cyanobacterium MO_167.B52]
MQLRDKKIHVSNPTLNRLITELGEECQNVITLVNQFQLVSLSNEKKVEILAELLASTIHLHSHCDEDLQDMISDELEILPDDV